LDEFSFIKEFLKPLTPTFQSHEMGIGDDCAVVATPEDSDFVISTDTLVEQRHFPRLAPWSLVIPRAIGTAVSDVSAMGGRCWGVTLAMTLPTLDYTLAQDIRRGCEKAIAEYRCQIVGGDTTQGPRAITVTTYAFLPSKSAVTRGNAQVGDDIWVTGTIGASALALMDLDEFDLTRMSDVQKRFWLPPYRGLIAADLRSLMTAAIDISDGMVGDLQHIANSSKVGIQIDTRLLPIDKAVLSQMSLSAAEELAISGGDDYELLFTANPKFESDIELVAKRHGVPIFKIGHVTDDSELIMLSTDGEIDIISEGGYTHF
jgi:thiamine-monophosphate kinase